MGKFMKRKILIDLGIAWLVFISLFGIIYIEQQIGSPWNRITNGLWIVGAIALVFFLVRGSYRLIRYEIDRRK